MHLQLTELEPRLAEDATQCLGDVDPSASVALPGQGTPSSNCFYAEITARLGKICGVNPDKQAELDHGRRRIALECRSQLGEKIRIRHYQFWHSRVEPGEMIGRGLQTRQRSACERLLKKLLGTGYVSAAGEVE